MRKIKFIFKRILDMDYKAMFATIKRIKGVIKQDGTKHKSSLILFIDMIRCALKYGAGYVDYEHFRFWECSPEQRATYVTRTDNNLLIARMNDKNSYYKLHDKCVFNQNYSEFMKRDWLDFRTASKEEFLSFIDGKNAIIVKPIDLFGGQGVEKLTVSDYESYDAIYEKLKTMPNAQLLEDYIVQHHTMSVLHPGSVNGVRVVTLLKNEEVSIVFTCVKIGNGGVVDNLAGGGVTAPVDSETGVVKSAACDKNYNKFDYHPSTNEKITGLQIPHWDKVIEMCKKAALVTPEIRYSGWDVAIREDGPVIIEGNYMPDYNFIQYPAHTPDKIGMKPLLNRILEGEMKL